jgi:hypothetical protein
MAVNSGNSHLYADFEHRRHAWKPNSTEAGRSPKPQHFEPESVQGANVPASPESLLAARKG